MNKWPVPFCLVYTFEAIANGITSTVTQKNNRMEPLHLVGLSFGSYSNASSTRATNWPFQIRTSGSDDLWFSLPIVPSLFGGSSNGYDTSNEASATVENPWFFAPVDLAYGQEISITAQNDSGGTSNAQFMLWGYYGDRITAQGRSLPGIIVTPDATLTTNVPSSQIAYNNRSLPFIARDMILAKEGTIDNFNLKAQIVLSGSGVKVFSDPVHVGALNGTLESTGSLSTAGSIAGRRPFPFPGGGLLIPPSSQIEVQLTNLSTNASAGMAAFRGDYAAQ